MVDFAQVPYGKTERVVVENFIPTNNSGFLATPAWMERYAGSVASGNTALASTGAGGSMLATVKHSVAGTPSPNVYGLRTIWDIDPTGLEMIRLDISSFQLSHNTMSAGLGMSNTAKTNGFSMWSNPGTPTFVTCRFGGDPGDEEIDYSWGGDPEYNRRRNIGVMLLPKTKQVYLVSDDQVIWYTVRPGMVLGNLRLFVETSKPTSTANTNVLYLGQMKVTLQHN